MPSHNLRLSFMGGGINTKVYALMRDLGFHRPNIHFQMPKERYHRSNLFVESHRSISPLESRLLRWDIETQEGEIRRLKEIARRRARRRMRYERRNKKVMLRSGIKSRGFSRGIWEGLI
jgi:hypothetical protein